MQSIKTTSVAKNASLIEEIVLKEEENKRIVFRWMFVDERQEQPWATVRGCIQIQKKSKNEEWYDPDKTPKRKNEIYEIDLWSWTIKSFYDQLTKLYWFRKSNWVPQWTKKLVEVSESNNILQIPKDKGERVNLLNKLISKEDDYDLILKELITNESLSKDIYRYRVLKNRQETLKIFKDSLDNISLSESYRQAFFDDNNWLFWYWLNYQILSNIKSQANYWWEDYTRRWEQKWDFLTHTCWDLAKFTVLVEIKKPSTNLVQWIDNYNRSWVYPLSNELLNGISQIQINCETWNKDESMNKSTAKKLEWDNIFTICPKWILIIWHTRQLDTEEKKYTFEVCRRNLNNPQVITFDELYHRAKYIVDHTSTD